jgi:hypothetical protein
MIETLLPIATKFESFEMRQKVTKVKSIATVIGIVKLWPSGSNKQRGSLKKPHRPSHTQPSKIVLRLPNTKNGQSGSL